MRDPARIDAVLAAVREAWSLHPDLRLGQLLVAAAGSGDGLFRVEDEALVRRVRDLLGRMGRSGK